MSAPSAFLAAAISQSAVVCALCLSASALHIAACSMACCAKRKRTSDIVVSGRAGNKHRKRATAMEELFSLDDNTFQRMMRIPRSLFVELCARIEPLIHANWSVNSRAMAILANGSVVEAPTILAATLRWLAGGSPWDVSFMFKVGIQTFHDYKWRVVDALNVVLKDNIRFPWSDVGLSCLAQGFADRNANIPNVVAAVDCCVLEMNTPERTKFNEKKQTNISSRFCRKGCYATTVLAFVDAHMRFLSVSITCGSSSHDSTHFSASNLSQSLSLPAAQARRST
jgi:hypothetical protein